MLQSVHKTTSGHGGARPGAGRKPRSADGGKRVTILLTHAEHEALTAAAARRSVTAADVVREALRKDRVFPWSSPRRGASQ